MPEAGGERLQQDRHQVRQHDHAEQRVAVARAAGEVGGPVAGVHVADRDEVARSGEGEELSPEAGAGGDGDGAMDLGQAQRAGGESPAARGELRVFWVTSRSIFESSKSNTTELFVSRKIYRIKQVAPCGSG